MMRFLRRDAWKVTPPFVRKIELVHSNKFEQITHLISFRSFILTTKSSFRHHIHSRLLLKPSDRSGLFPILARQASECPIILCSWGICSLVEGPFGVLCYMYRGSLYFPCISLKCKVWTRHSQTLSSHIPNLFWITQGARCCRHASSIKHTSAKYSWTSTTPWTTSS